MSTFHVTMSIQLQRTFVVEAGESWAAEEEAFRLYEKELAERPFVEFLEEWTLSDHSEDTLSVWDEESGAEHHDSAQSVVTLDVGTDGRR